MDSFDWDGNEAYSYGEWNNSWIDDGDGEPDLNDVITWNDTYPFENGQWDEGLNKFYMGFWITKYK